VSGEYYMKKPKKEKFIEMVVLIVFLALGLFQEKLIYFGIGLILISSLRFYFDFKRKKNSNNNS
jgi:hypothetical protein